MLTVSLMKRETQLCHFIKMLLVELAGQLQSQSIFRLNSSDKDQKSSLFSLDTGGGRLSVGKCANRVSNVPSV